jgi:hypothetical protein
MRASLAVANRQRPVEMMVEMELRCMPKLAVEDDESVTIRHHSHETMDFSLQFRYALPPSGNRTASPNV